MLRQFDPAMSRLFDRVALRLVACVVAAMTASGCATWQHSKAPLTPEFSGPIADKQVRLLLDDGRWHLVRDACVAGDSLIGVELVPSGGSFLRDPQQHEEPFAVSLERIRGAETYRIDKLQTTLLVLGFAAVIVAALMLHDQFGGLGSWGNVHGTSTPASTAR